VGAAPLPASLRPALTAIRFPLAVWVVLYHLSKPWLVQTDGVARNLLAGAPVAVPFFFVLSGFVLTLTYDGRLDVRRYARARFARIAPLYGLAVLLAVPVGLAARARGLVDDPQPLLSLGAVLFAVQAWIPAFSLRWNPALWSVSVEVFLYACVPLLLPLVARLAGTRALVVAFGCAALAALPPLVYVAIAPDGALPGKLDDEATWFFVVRFNPALRIFELLAGMCGARAFVSGARVPMIVGVLAAAALALLLASGSAPPVLLFGGGTALLSTAIVLALAPVERGPLVSALAVKLGETSYALYALHLPVFFWMLGLAKRAPADVDLGFGAAVLVASLAIASAAHRLVEEPARRAMNRSQSSGS
jgi:peptidoglycan/LPS O-acetylase OafA/YrhL